MVLGVDEPDGPFGRFGRPVVSVVKELRANRQGDRKMTPQRLLNLIKADIVEANLEETFRQLGSADMPREPSPDWLAMKRLFQAFNDEQREALRGLLHRAAVNTASSILSVVDGNTYMLIGTPEVALFWNRKNLSGEPQEALLEACQG